MKTYPGTNLINTHDTPLMPARTYEPVKIDLVSSARNYKSYQPVKVDFFNYK